MKGDLSSQEALSHDTSLFIVTLCPIAQLICTLLRVCFDINGKPLLVVEEITPLCVKVLWVPRKALYKCNKLLL